MGHTRTSSSKKFVPLGSLTCLSVGFSFAHLGKTVRCLSWYEFIYIYIPVYILNSAGDLKQTKHSNSFVEEAEITVKDRFFPIGSTLSRLHLQVSCPAVHYQLLANKNPYFETMSHPVPTNSHSRHSYSPSRPRYYAPPHHSQHPQMPSMWQPHLHHHPASHVHHPGHGSRPHPITHHYHMPHSLARPDDVVRPAPSVVDHSMYPSDRRDPNDHYSHRHRASYPPVLHASMPGPYSGLPNWKNTHYESQGLENPRHDEARKAPAVDIPSPDEDTEEPPVTAVEKSNNQDPEPNVMKSADKTAVSETAKQIVTVNSKEERATPGSTRKAASLLEEKFQQSLKSPVTMCFERFLGAGKFGDLKEFVSVRYFFL